MDRLPKKTFLGLAPRKFKDDSLGVLSNSVKEITTINTYIGVFPTSKRGKIEMRSNARWNEISHALRNGHQFILKNKVHSFGYLGECWLTNLAFIDRGRSFMSDTLRTIYHNPFVSYKRLST